MALHQGIKRRRLNDEINTLKRPFVSPLKTRSSHQLPLAVAESVACDPYWPSTVAHTISRKPTVPLPRRTPLQGTLIHTATKSTPIRKSRVSLPGNGRQPIDPAEAAAQKAIMTLELHVRMLQNDLDALKQASSLRSSNTDANLEDLSLKWKLASQAVAEELFGTVKERVNRMGGVAAWRESEKNKYDRSHGLDAFAEEPAPENDADCEFDSQGEELPEEEQEWRKKQKRKAKEEAMDAAESDQRFDDEQDPNETKVWQEPIGDDDAFTIDMMLRSLNIELDVIGYDRTAQRWVT